MIFYYEISISYYNTFFGGLGVSSETEKNIEARRKKGEGNSVNFKFRMHDPRVGRFLSLDPLAPKYPHNSPYVFAENRVIDGVELEGLEYLDTDESRISISWGETVLNNENISGPTAAKFDVKYPKTGSFVDYGFMDTEYPSNPSSLESQVYNKALAGAEPYTFFSGKHNKNGQMHKTSAKSPKNWNVVGGGFSSTKGLVKLNVVVGAVEAIGWGMMWYQSKEVEADYELSRLHEQIYFEEVVPIMSEALNSGEKYIPNNDLYRNDFSLSLIANAVLYGEKNEGYEELYEIGIKIFNDLGKNKPKNKIKGKSSNSKGLNLFQYWWNTNIKPQLEAINNPDKE